MPRGKQTLSQEVKALKSENTRLKRQLKALQQPKSQPSGKWRTAAIVILSGLAGAILISANLIFWTARTVVETDRYTEATKSLIEKPSVQKAIADKTTDAIFARVDTEKLLQENLPPRVQFAAPTLSEQIQNFTNQKARQVVASDKFQDVWVSTNTNAHKRFIDAIRDYKGDGTINLSDVYSKLTQRLQGTNLAFVQNIQLPSNIGSIQIIDAPWLPSAHYVVVNLDAIRYGTIALFFVLTAAIVAVARDRRRIAFKLGVFYALLMLATLVAVRIAQAVVVGQAESQYQLAVTDAYQAVLNPFVLQTASLMVLAIVVSTVAWLAGASNSAGRVKTAFNHVFQGKVHTAIFGKKENAYTKWVGKYQVQLQWISVLIAFITLLLISITVTNIVWVLIGLIIALAVLQLSAADK